MTELRRRPAVHQLCAGAFLQEPLRLRETLLATPLTPLGFGSEGLYAAQFVTEVLGGSVSTDRVQELLAQGTEAHPVVVITVFPAMSGGAPGLEASAQADLLRARQILTWASGDEITPFAMVSANSDGTFFRLIAPHSRRRQRLGFGNTGEDFYGQLRRIDAALDEDEHFVLALSLLHDAVREENHRFRVARFFNVLECLAYKLKSTRKSRSAIRHMIGPDVSVFVEAVLGDERYRFDVVEVGGRIRDALLHGSEFRVEDLNAASRPAYRLYSEHPEQIADQLQAYCELEIARWANGVSRGRNPPKEIEIDPAL